jgi:glycosyltransferase involved in cell wall biosynthesis
MTNSSDNLRILILNRDLPVFPGWGGIEFLHTTRLARHARRVGLVSSVHTAEQLEKGRQLKDAGVNLFLWKSPRLGAPESDEASPILDKKRISEALYNGIRTILLKPKDTFVPNLQFSHLAPSVIESFNGKPWDVLVIVQSSSGHWLDFIPPVPVSVLILHDARALLYRRKAKSETRFFSRISSLVQAFLYFCFERRVVEKYDLVITVSSTDEQWVRKHYRPRHICTIPIPVDADYFCPLPPPRTNGKIIMFTGMMNHPPNSDAACFFAEKVFPKIKAVIQDAEFWVVGRDPTDEVKALASAAGVTVTGFVADIRQYIAMADVIVVPLRFGSGMRQKILEAWGMEKCVVSTTIGAEGLNYVDGSNILIADDSKGLASKTIKALLDPSLSGEISKKGRKVVVREHHPDVLGKNYYDAIRRVLLEKRATSRPMRILIDLRWMIPGLAGGIEDLSRSFINCLQRLDHFNHYGLLVPAQQKYDLNVRRKGNFSVIPHEGPSQTFSLISRKALRLVHSALSVPYWRSDDVNFLLDSRNWGTEVALSIPGYFNPDLRLLSNVLIVPDIQHDYHPEFFCPQDSLRHF